MDPAHVRLGRLNAGAPLLDTHGSYSVRDMLGAVVPGTAVMKGKEGRATVQFSKRADVDGIWGDVQDGTLRNVSVGYRVYAFEEVTPKGNALPIRTATDWEPFEISMVPMPADAGAQVRDGKPVEGANPCTVTVRTADQSQEQRMNPEPSEAIAEIDPLTPAVTAGRTEPAITLNEPTDQDRARDAERARINGIRKACKTGRMTPEFEQRLIDENTPLVRAQELVFDEMRARGGDDRGPQRPSGDSRVRMGDDPTLHVRAGIAEALCHRLAGDLRKSDGTAYFVLTDKGREYRGMTLMDIARAHLHGLGIRTSGMSKHDIAGVALGLTGQRSGMHTTSDFTNLLADVANKTLRAAYSEQPQTFRPIVRVTTLPDFKVANRVQLGDAPALLEVVENGEIKQGTISDGKETLQLTTYARMFAITRKALINDDTDAFSRVPQMFGRKARVLESNLVWAQITSNPTMGDTNALFSAAHANLQTDGDHISIASLDRARAAMGVQTSVDGEYLNLSPVYLIVPVALQTKAQQFTSQITPALSSSVNPFGTLQVIAEPRLDANSTTAWYLAASPAQVDIIELAYLEGEEGPRVESQIGFDIEGLKIKCGLDVTAKAIDWRGLHKDPGDLDS